MPKLSVNTMGSLARVQAVCTDRVDELAEQARQRMLTPGSGQSMTYDAKYTEAQAFSEGRVSETPWLDAEAEALGTTREAVAESVLKARAQWEQAGIQIEAARLKAKAEVAKALTAQDMHRITQQLRQQLGLDGVP